MNTIENVEIPLLLSGVNPDEARSLAKKSLEKVGLGDRLNHRPQELSGASNKESPLLERLFTTLLSSYVMNRQEPRFSNQ